MQQTCLFLEREEVMIREGIQAFVEGRNLTEAEAIAVMREIRKQRFSRQIAAFIVGLRMKGRLLKRSRAVPA